MSFEGTIDRFPEATRSRAELLARARQVAWYHTLRLDPAFTSKGIFALDEFSPSYLLPDSLEGLDCLDIGTGNGYWAFQLESRNARRVVATDIGDYSETDFSRTVGGTPPAPSPAAPGEYGEPFRLAASLLGSGVEYRLHSAYNLRPELVGTFDFVFCGSVIMHLFGPLLALQRMADVCRDTLLLATQTAPELDGRPLSLFRGHEIPYVHFIPSPSCLVEMVRSCGYQRVLRGPTFMLRFRDRVAHPEELPHTTIIAQKDPAASRVPFPEAPPRQPRECRARAEIVSAPDAVRPGQEFAVVVRITNEGEAPWLGMPQRALGLGFESSLGTLVRREGWEFSRLAQPFLDYLPSRLSTMARLRVLAPLRTGDLRIRPVPHQGGERFPCDAATAIVSVRADAPVTEGVDRRHAPKGSLRASLRVADRFLRVRVQQHPGLSEKYEQLRGRVRRLLGSRGTPQTGQHE